MIDIIRVVDPINPYKGPAVGLLTTYPIKKGNEPYKGIEAQPKKLYTAFPPLASNN